MEHEDNDISDLESDLDPDESLETWLKTKIALFETDPSLAESLRKRSKASNKSTLRLQNGLSHQTSRRAKTLAEKLQKIESDVLFDQHEADSRWAKHRIGLVKGLARIPRSEDTGSAGQEALDEARSTTDSSELLDNGEGNAFENLFASVPHDDASGVEAAPRDHSNGSERLLIRDFGKSKGVGPRRVLGEACQARYEPLMHLHKPLGALAHTYFQRYRCEIHVRSCFGHCVCQSAQAHDCLVKRLYAPIPARV